MKLFKKREKDLDQLWFDIAIHKGVDEANRFIDIWSEREKRRKEKQEQEAYYKNKDIMTIYRVGENNKLMIGGKHTEQDIVDIIELLNKFVEKR